MKKLLLILLTALIAFGALAQTKPTQTVTGPGIRGVVKDQLEVDSVIFMPLRADTNFLPGRAGAAIYRTADKQIYIYNGTYWQKTLYTITGLIAAGANVSIAGSGAVGDPYIISASGGSSGTNRPFFLVSDYGAVGDGTTDDRVAVQNAITAAAAVGGIVLFDSIGTYRIGTTVLSGGVTRGLTLVNNSVIWIPPGATVKLGDNLVSNATAVQVFHIPATADNVYIGWPNGYGGTIDGNTAGNQSGCTTCYGQANGRYLIGAANGANGVTVEGLHLIHSFSNVIQIGGGSVYGSNSNIRLSNLYAEEFGEGIEVSSADHVSIDNVTQIMNGAILEGDGLELAFCRNFTASNINTLTKTGSSISTGGAGIDLFASRDGVVTNFNIQGTVYGFQIETDFSDNSNHPDSISVSNGIMRGINFSPFIFTGGNISVSNVQALDCKFSGPQVSKNGSIANYRFDNVYFQGRCQFVVNDSVNLAGNMSFYFNANNSSVFTVGTCFLDIDGLHIKSDSAGYILIAVDGKTPHGRIINISADGFYGSGGVQLRSSLGGDPTIDSLIISGNPPIQSFSSNVGEITGAQIAVASGTINSSNLPKGSRGQVVTMNGQLVPTFENGSRLKLLNGEDVTLLTTNDQIVLEYGSDDTWREISRSITSVSTFPNLQQVTDQGYITTDSITVGGALTVGTIATGSSIDSILVSDNGVVKKVESNSFTSTGVIILDSISDMQTYAGASYDVYVQAEEDGGRFHRYFGALPVNDSTIYQGAGSFVWQRDINLIQIDYSAVNTLTAADTILTLAVGQFVKRPAAPLAFLANNQTFSGRNVTTDFLDIRDSLRLGTVPTGGGSDSILVKKTDGGIYKVAQSSVGSGITTLNTLTASIQTFATGTSGSDFNISSATSTHTFNLPTASASNRGALSSTDWSTFNSKESALTFSTGLTRSTNTITNNLSTGVSGGQTAIGGTASGNNLTLSSTSNATKGKILFGSNAAYDETAISLGIGTTSPSYPIQVSKTVTGDVLINATNLSTAGGAVFAGFRADNSTSYGQMFKTGTNYSTYKTITAGDFGIFNGIAGNMPFLNDVSSGNMSFTAGANTTPHLIIMPSGFLGVNKSNPSYRLDIAGQVHIDTVTNGTAGTDSLLVTNAGLIKKVAASTYSSGTVTSVATNTGTGITGGTITTTGTIAADTTLLSTRLWRQKGIDSIAALANSKQTALSGTGLISFSGTTPSYNTTSASIAAIISDEIGTAGGLVFSGSPTIVTPTFTTSATTPLLIGGPGTTSTLTLQSSSGSATTGSDIILKDDNTEWMRILNNGNVGIGDASPNSLFTVGSGDLFQIDASGMVGMQQAPQADYLLSIIGTSTTDNSQLINLVQNNDAAEDNYVIFSTSTPNLGTLSSGGRTASGIYQTLTPTASMQGSVILTMNATDNNIDLTNLAFNNSGGSLTAIRPTGFNVSLTGSPTVTDVTAAGQNQLTVVGANNSVVVTPVWSSSTDLFTFTSTGEIISNGCVSTGDANWNSIANGLTIAVNGNLTTTGTTSHNGTTITVSGTADNNLGLSIATTGATTSNTALKITSPAAASTDYALNITATAQNSIAGNTGIGGGASPITTPTAYLHLAAGTASANTAPIKLTTGTLLTTPEVGSFGYNNSFYMTNNDLNRFGLGGPIKDFFTDVQNSGTSETDLYTYTLKANSLSENGQKIEAEYVVYFTPAIGTSTQTIKVYFAGSSSGSIVTLTGGLSGEPTTVRVSIIRVSSSVVRFSVTATNYNGVFTTSDYYTELTGLTLSNTEILKITGQSTGTGAATGDLTAKMGNIKLWSAANN